MQDSRLEELKSNNPITEVARNLDFNLKGYDGNTKVSRCFNHEDKNPSLVFMPEVNRFECKSCGVKGDVIELIKEVKKTSFKEAVLWLDSTYYNQSQPVNSTEYLRKERGINKKTQEKFKLRCESNKIVIPLPTGEKYRWLSGEVRYSQKKGTSGCLYKVAEAKEFVILTEGEFDALKLWQETGHPTWTGTAGVETFKSEWLSDLKDIKKVYLAFDSDEAGDKAATDLARKIGVGRSFRLKPSHGKDWTDYFVKHSKAKGDFDRLLGEAKQIIQPLKSGVKVSWPETLAERAFYGVAGETVKAIEPHSEADPVALLVNFLTAFGSVVGDKPYFKVEAALHPMRIFGVLVGETSKARKGTSWDYIKNLFGGLDEDWKHAIQSGLSSGEGLIWAVRDEITKRQPIKQKGRIIDYEDVVIDPGTTDKRLLIVEAEFASTLRVLGREGNTLSAIIRNAWDTGDLQSLTKNSQARATGAHISIIGHITKDELLRYLTNTEAANGFGNRFLWFCVRRSKSLPFGGKIQEVDFVPLVKKVKAAIDFAKQTEEIKWSKEASLLWAKIYPDLSEGKVGLTGALTARAEANVTRLACIYALLDKSTVIEPEHLLAAVAVWDYAENSVAFIFRSMTGDPLANDILEALGSKPEGMTRTDVSNYFGRNKSSEQISAALEVLQGLGRVKSESVPTAGRSKELWFSQSKKT